MNHRYGISTIARAISRHLNYSVYVPTVLHWFYSFPFTGNGGMGESGYGSYCGTSKNSPVKRISVDFTPCMFQHLFNVYGLFITSVHVILLDYSIMIHICIKC